MLGIKAEIIEHDIKNKRSGKRMGVFVAQLSAARRTVKYDYLSGEPLGGKHPHPFCLALRSLI